MQNCGSDIVNFQPFEISTDKINFVRNSRHDL
jgi:hypothetical protein